jgi:hypothetical protein
MSKQITLQAWASARFDPPPSAKTLRRWARDCWIFPVPQKVGREYRVDEDARFIGSNHENIYGSAAA